jgi:phage replication-related protein YjqB (UPF0714/DUF867 family)
LRSGLPPRANARHLSDPEHLRESGFSPKLAGRPSVMNGAAKGELIARGKNRLHVQEKLGAETL